jgi:Zn-dependent peptidase ImmA (M78 family)
LIERFDLKRLPIDVVELARRSGADLSYKSFGPNSSVSGMLFRDDTHTIIGVNRDQPNVRQRFTIAHEIGHLALHKGRPIVLDMSIRVNWRQDLPEAASVREEIEANAFAAALLMPSDLVAARVRDFTRGREGIDDKALTVKLARAFMVSPEAMTYRLISLGLKRTG